MEAPRETRASPETKAPGHASAPRSVLSTEVLTMLLVGVALGALVLTTTGEIREDMRERFSAIESRMSSVESQVSSLNSQVSSLNTRVSSLSSRVSSLSSRVSSLSSRVSSMEVQIVGLTREMGELRGVVAGRSGPPPLPDG